MKLSPDQRLDWLRLIRSENVGPRGIMAQTPQPIMGCGGACAQLYCTAG
jgi:DprA/Smf-like nucleotide binding protein involved in DNA uptake